MSFPNNNSEPQNFRVLINDTPMFEKTFAPRPKEIQLNATCQLVGAGPNIQLLPYQYKWVQNSRPDDVLAVTKTYKAFNLGAGSHTYTVTVTCGTMERQSIARVTVSDLGRYLSK